MKILYSNQPYEFFQQSIFLAGPTPRRKEVTSWRPAALELLQALNYQGAVYVPEWIDFAPQIDYISQVEWEFNALETAKVIAFWIPRNLETMPAFTTNVEFGRYSQSCRTLYGRPPDAPNTRYLDWLYEKMNCHYGIKRGLPFTSLKELLEQASIDAL